jgi:hypothetical protein
LHNLADNQVAHGYAGKGSVYYTDLEQTSHAILKYKAGKGKFEQLPAKTRLNVPPSTWQHYKSTLVFGERLHGIDDSNNCVRRRDGLNTRAFLGLGDVQPQGVSKCQSNNEAEDVCLARECCG